MYTFAGITIMSRDICTPAFGGICILIEINNRMQLIRHIFYYYSSNTHAGIDRQIFINTQKNLIIVLINTF